MVARDNPRDAHVHEHEFTFEQTFIDVPIINCRFLAVLDFTAESLRVLYRQRGGQRASVYISERPRGGAGIAAGQTTLSNTVINTYIWLSCSTIRW